jgi:hypothetical protein
LISAVIFIRHGDFNVRLSSSVYYVAHRFYNSAYIFEIRLDFGNPPIFWKSAYIFHEAPIFWASAYILSKRLYFEQAPIFWVSAYILSKRLYFWASANILWFFFCAANICVYFQYLFMHLYEPIFLAQLFWSLGLRLILL